MTTFLKKWNILINEELCPYQESLNRLAEDEISTIIKESAAEVENVRNLLMEYFVNTPSISDKENFVKVNRRSLSGCWISCIPAEIEMCQKRY